MSQPTTVARQGHIFRQLCKQGSVELAQQMLTAGTPIDLPQEDGCTGLWLAAESGHVEMVRMLCSHSQKPNVNAVKEVGNISPLYIASQNGHNAVVDILLLNGANPNLCKSSGAGPLYIASQQNFPDIVRSLLKAGANYNAVNHRGISPLMIAAYQGNLAVVKQLLAAGADPYAAAQSKTAVEWAAEGGHRSDVQQAIDQHMRMLEAELRRKREAAGHHQTPTSGGGGGGGGGDGYTPSSAQHRHHHHHHDPSTPFQQSMYAPQHRPTRDVSDSFLGYTPRYLVPDASSAAPTPYTNNRSASRIGRSPSPQSNNRGGGGGRQHYNTRSFSAHPLPEDVGRMQLNIGITPDVIKEEQRRNESFRHMVKRDHNAGLNRSRSLVQPTEPPSWHGPKSKRDLYTTQQEWELHKERLLALEEHNAASRGDISDAWMYSASATTQYASQMREIRGRMKEAERLNREQSQQQKEGSASEGFALPRLPPKKISELHRFMAAGRDAKGPPPPLPPEEPLPPDSYGMQAQLALQPKSIAVVDTAAGSAGGGGSEAASPYGGGGGASTMGAPTAATSGLTSAGPEPASPGKKLTAMEKLALKKAQRAN